MATTSAILFQLPQTRVQQSVRRSRQPLLVCSSADVPSRRTALALGVGALVLSLTGPSSAKKTDIPFHASLRGVGSTSEASQSAFDMEGTKKRGISPAQRKKLLAAIKERIPVPGAAS